MDQYLESQKEKVFRNVQTLIYIFDITSTAATDMVYFVDILSALRAGSGPGESNGSIEAGPKLHVLIHKMDLIENNGGQPTYDAKAAEIRSKCAAAGWNEPSLYATSIFNESLYSVRSVVRPRMRCADWRCTGLVRHSLDTEPACREARDASLAVCVADTRQ